MEVVQKVLIATDGSDHARKAVEFGSDIAATYGAEVVLVHVLLRDELSEDLRHLADGEYHAGEGGRPLSEAIAMMRMARRCASIWRVVSSSAGEKAERARSGQSKHRAGGVCGEDVSGNQDKT